VALPLTRHGLPSNITRASHVELHVADLERSLRFYTEVIGLAVTLREDGVAWLRGMEESCHHSLVLRTTTQAPACPYLGFRVFSDEELDRLAEHLGAAGLTPFVGVEVTGSAAADGPHVLEEFLSGGRGT
jgi:catechol 2,3-dioxygenase